MPPGVFLLGPGPLGSKAGSGDGRGWPAESGMGPPAGMVRARLPASPLFSVSGREPRARCFGFGGPPAGMVRARPPANPLFSVFGREPRAECFGIRGPPAGMVRARLPANPLFSVSGREPRAECFGIRGPPAGFSGARFAPRSPLTLAAPFRGANSSHKFRAAGRGRPAFPRRGLLPANREPLRLRFGEQNLHTISAPQAGAVRFFQGAVCSPLTGNPCDSVPGSKFFTQIPRRRPRPAGHQRWRTKKTSPRQTNVIKLALRHG